MVRFSPHQLQRRATTGGPRVKNVYLCYISLAVIDAASGRARVKKAGKVKPWSSIHMLRTTYRTGSRIAIEPTSRPLGVFNRMRTALLKGKTDKQEGSLPMVKLEGPARFGVVWRWSIGRMD